MLRHWLQLALTEGIGPILTRRLIDTTGSAEAACDVSVNGLRSIEGIGPSKAAKIHQSLQGAARGVEKEMALAERMGVRVICFDDAEYPVLLKQIPDPPGVLYVKGSIEPRDLNAVAIVGSRKCSHYGREQAERFAALLAGAGVTVISGGARGVDSSAHRGAMSHPMGRTIAVLGCGVDIVYPPENDKLFAQIETKGVVISEYPLGTPPQAENFPRRNRIVSGMSRGVLVIEADERSGALITARQAGDDHGRPVFAVPGRVDNPLSAGPHLLIRDGATLVRNLEDILDGLGPLPADAVDPDLFGDLVGVPDSPASFSKATPPEPIGLSDRQRTILEHLSKDPAAVDTVIERTALSAAIVLQELTMLSLKGLVRRVDGQTFARR